MTTKTTIPTGWKQVILKDLGSFSKGLGVSKAELLPTGLNAVRYGELYMWHHFKIKKIRSFISEESAKTSKKIKFGDILFAGSGETIDEIGKSAAYLFHEDCYAGGDTIIFSPKNCNSLFLSFLLNTGNARKELRRLGQGQSVVHIYKSDLESVNITLPSLEEQGNIVEVIDTWDNYLEKLTNIIKLKKGVKKGLMQKLFTGKVRIPGFESEWLPLQLAKVTQNISRRNKDLKIVRVLSVTNKKGFVLPENQFSKVVASKDVSNYKIIIKNNFAYNPSRINVGSIARLDNFDNGILSPMYVIFSLDESVINSNFFKNWLLTNRTKASIKNAASGSVRESVDYSSFASIKIDLPSLEEQTAIANILTTADQEIEALEKKKDIIEKQKKFLLNNLITGKIRLPEFTH